MRARVATRPAYYCYTHSAAGYTTWRAAQVSEPRQGVTPASQQAASGEPPAREHGVVTRGKQRGRSRTPTTGVQVRGPTEAAKPAPPAGDKLDKRSGSPSATAPKNDRSLSLSPHNRIRRAHSDALVTATSRNSCSYTSPKI